MHILQLSGLVLVRCLVFFSIVVEIENFGSLECNILLHHWGEGTKIGRGEVCLANTDPAMVRCFIQWLKILGVSKDKLRIQLSLYKDMDISQEIRYWSKELDVSMHQFRNPYIKESSLIDITYRNGFGHGTCNVRLGNQVFTDYVLMGIRYIREQYNLTRL